MINNTMISLLFVIAVVTFSAAHSIQVMLEDNETRQKNQLDMKPTKSFANSTVVPNPLHNTSEKSCRRDTDCLPWTKCNVSNCVCNKELLQSNAAIRCDEVTLQLSVLAWYCVTFDNKTKHLIEGQCLETSEAKHYVQEYLPLPKDVSNLNKFMCEDRWNRTGRLCGKCLPGHSPLAYSYDMTCVKCPEGNKNVWKYILAAFGPLTIFYFIVLFFKINATSSHLHGFILFSQVISAPTFVRNIVMYEQIHKDLKKPLQIVTVLYSIVNLDFFKGVYPDICLDVSPLTAMALDYTVAIYPLLLTVVSYFLIELHDRNFRLVVYMWKPFRCVFTLFRRNWNSRTTVIDAYATFFLLSFLKILWVSSDLLTPVTVHDLNSDNYSMGLYYDATIEYFGREHLPYAILALVLTTVLVVIPTLLLLFYPFQWFQKVLNCLKIRCRILTVLMESFHGCYKNGTETGTRDCRWFAAVPLIGRFILLLSFAVILDRSFLPVGIAVIASIIILIAIVQPYKHQFGKYIKIDVLFWGLLVIFFSVEDSATYSSLKQETFKRMIKIARYIAIPFPLIYIFCVIVYWMVSRMRKVKILIDRIKAWRRGYANLEDEFEAILPDRLVNPEQYQRENLQEPICPTEVANDIDTY